MPKPKITKTSPDAEPSPSPALPTIDRRKGRTAKGTFAPGVSGRSMYDAAKARKVLNVATIRAMQEAFDKYGKEAIVKTIKTQPATFLKLLVFLVPRELEVTHTQGVKQMTDEAIDQAIEAIQDLLERRNAGMVDVTPSTVGSDVGKDDDKPD